jgi:hypothetical protein
VRKSSIFGVVFALVILFIFFAPVFSHTFPPGSFATAGSSGTITGSVSFSYYLFNCGTVNNVMQQVAGGQTVSIHGYDWTCG